MSTYTDLHTRKRENLTILRQPNSPIDGLTPQRVIFSNPNNIYNGLFKGQLNVTSAILSNSILNDCEINGGLINDATTIYSDGRKIFLADLYDMIDSLSDELSDIWKNIRGGLNYTGNLSVDVDFSTFTNLLRYNYYPEQPPEKYREGFFYVVQTPQRGSHYIVEGLEVEHGDWVIFNKNVEFQNLTSADVEIFDAQDFDNFRLSSDNYAKGNNTFEGNTHFIGNVDISGSVAISNDLAVNGTTKLEDVEFGGEASFGGNAVISGDLTVAGDSTLSTIIVNGQTTLNDATNIAKDLSVAGNTTIVSNVNISANATINDVKVLQNLSVDGSAVISGQFEAKDDATIDKNLTVYGDASISGNVEVSSNSTFYGKVNIDDNLSVTGVAQIDNNLSVYGKTYIDQALDVNQIATFKDNLVVEKDLSIQNDVSISGSLEVIDAATFKDHVVIEDNLSVNENAYVNGILSVVDNATFDKNVSINDNLSVDGELNVSSNSKFASDLSIQQNLIVSGDANINGAVTIDDDATFNKNVLVKKDLSVNENAYVNGNINVSGFTTFSSDATFKNNVKVEDDLSISGSAYISNNVVISNDLVIGQDVTSQTLSSDSISANSIRANSNLYVDGNASISIATISSSTLLTAYATDLSIDISAVKYIDANNSICSLQDLSSNIQTQLIAAQLSVSEMSSMLTSILSNEMRYFGTFNLGYSTSNVDLSTFLYANIKDNAYQFHKGYQYRISSDISGTNSAITINDGHHQKVLFSNDYIIFNQYVALSDATWSHIDIIRDAQAECDQLSGRVDKLSSEVNTISTNLSNAISANLDKISALSDSLSYTSAYLSSHLSNNCQVVSALSNAISATANVGDIAIVSAYISLSGDKPISRTAYCWNGTNWEALDGNYNIRNVYFDQDMTFTEKFGHYDVPTSGYYQIDSKGKSLFSVIDEAFKQATSGKKTPPTFSLTVAGGSNEVGNTYSIPSATFTMTSIGSYPTYGPNDTGISVLPGNAFIKSNDYPSLSSRNETSLRKNGSISTSISGSVAYTDATSTYSYSASAEWIEGVAPKNNLGEDDPGNRILSGISSLTASASFTGYRYGFYGYRLSSENRLDFSMLNSNDIRLSIHVPGTYGKRWIATSGNNWPTKFTVPKNSTQIIFAVPENAVDFNNHKYIKMSNIALGTYYFENDGLLRDPTTTGLSVDGAVSGTGKKYYVWTINPPGIFDKDAEYTIEYSSSKIQ